MKSVGLIILLAASWVNTAFGKSNLYTGWKQKISNASYPDLTAQVGDTITFIWTDEQVQNVFIHPTNNCTQTGRIAVGNQSPTEYTFKPEDGAPGGKSIFFANDIGDRCENFGMSLIIIVFPDSDDGEIPDVTLTLAPINPPTSPPVIQTDFPVAPTFPPVAPVAPTGAPIIPTLAPVLPTFSPVAPTVAPVVPTTAPVVPTNAPVVPTNAPVVPTNAPVVPTNAPVVPTNAPVVPTEAPISPTATPTETPTSPPVPFPTTPPTPGPTAKPTNSPTSPPTIPPSVATGVPTEIPITKAPVEATSNFPTENSNDVLNRETMRGLQMTLSGIDSFSDKAKKGWTEETQVFCTSYYENDIKGGDFSTSIAVTNSFVSSDSRRLMRGSERYLQTGDVIITFDQVVSYTNTGDADITKDYLAKSPFDTLDQRNNYVDALQNSNYPVLEAVTDVSSVTFADEIVPTSAPVNVQPQPAIDPKKFNLDLSAIIGIACGVGALLIIAILFCIYSRARKSKDKSQIDSDPPPTNVDIKADEVSTLAGPSIPGNAPPYGDRSIGTVDYDYSKAYEDRDHSVSYAGGTLGSDTQDFSFPANAGATGAALGPYDDDGSYGDNFRNSGAKVKEEILHIFAPPGKLGVVIDTPDDGAPVVHAVKETSVVVDKVKVGDKLVAVDDEDVRTLTAIKVSKLISRKSANPSRKLTILRITHIG